MEPHIPLNGKATRQRADKTIAAFTLTELLVVLATLALLVATLLPALAHSRSGAQALQCLNNHKQLLVAWQLYAADFSDHVPNNFVTPGVEDAITSGRLDNWANNVMTWTVDGLRGSSNTNLAFVTEGVLGKYTGRDGRLYKCPADTYLSPVQRAAGWTQRNRSVSMNCLFGYSGANEPYSSQGLSWYESGHYRQFLRTADVPSPGRTWVTVDEHADSINNGFFVVDLSTIDWGDVPGSYHDGACTFSFADGHVETHEWLSATSKYPVKFGAGVVGIRPFDRAGKQDFQWYKERCAFILAR